MKYVILDLNYLSVVVTAIVGFLLGWLWYSPVMFARAWRKEMKITDAMVRAAAAKKGGMFRLLGLGFIYNLLSTFGLAVFISVYGLIRWRHETNLWLHGAEVGLFFGAFLVGARMLNTAVWEKRSWKLQAISIGHELVLFTVQGAILAFWN